VVDGIPAGLPENRHIWTTHGTSADENRVVLEHIPRCCAEGIGPRGRNRQDSKWIATPDAQVQQPVVKRWLHSTGDASSPVSVPRQRFATCC
jgi:hypothetical protein